MTDLRTKYSSIVQKSCRSCLQIYPDENLIYIFGGERRTLKLFKNINYDQFTIQENDEFPQNVCNKCVELLENVNSFKAICEKSQKILVELFRSSNETEDEINEQINYPIEYTIQEEVCFVDETALDTESKSTTNFEFLSLNTSISNELLEVNAESIANWPLPENPICEINDTKDENQTNFARDSNNRATSETNKRQKSQKIDIHQLDVRQAEENCLNKSLPECPICKKLFKSISNRNTHLDSHNDENAFPCGECEKGFKSKVYLNKHKKMVHTVSDKEYQCTICLQTFNNTRKFEYHLKAHNPDKKFKCGFCKKSFMQSHHKKNHERTHTGISPFLCNVCGKDFKQECNFKLHLRIHSDIRPTYSCGHCKKDFVHRASYVVHMRQKHDKSKSRYQCEHCAKFFIQKSSLNVHLRIHNGEKPFQCSLCPKKFSQSQQLNYHFSSAHVANKVVGKLKSRTESSTFNVQPTRPYVCEVCQKGFKLPSSLSSHKKVHLEENIRKHNCNLCNCNFKRAEHLRIHINGVHLKQKPFKCEFCDKSFAQSGDRNIHAKRHTGEKPFVCSYCDKKFRLIKALKAHLRIHTGDKPYECELCEMKFMTYTTLATHTLKHQVSRPPNENDEKMSPQLSNIN